MDVDDPLTERFEEALGVDAVVAGIDHELDPMTIEELSHRGVALLGRCK